MKALETQTGRSVQPLPIAPSPREAAAAAGDPRAARAGAALPAQPRTAPGVSAGERPARGHRASSVLLGETMTGSESGSALLAGCAGLGWNSGCRAAVSWHPPCAQGGKRDGQRCRGMGVPHWPPWEEGSLSQGLLSPGTGFAAGDRGVTRQDSFPEDG